VPRIQAIEAAARAMARAQVTTSNRDPKAQLPSTF
jgi:hypothetical protein